MSTTRPRIDGKRRGARRPRRERGRGSASGGEKKTKEGQLAHQTTQARPGETAKAKGEGKSDGNKETKTPPEEGEGTAGDEPGYNPTPEDLRLREVYRDWFHANLGTHLDGGIRDDSAWKAWWRDLAVMPSRRYDTLSERVGRRFVRTLGEELKGGAGQTVELGAVHRLSDGDPATSPSCQQIPGHLSAHRKAAGRLGGEEAFHAGRGHAASVRRILHFRPEGGDGGSPG